MGKQVESFMKIGNLWRTFDPPHFDTGGADSPGTNEPGPADHHSRLRTAPLRTWRGGRPQRLEMAALMADGLGPRPEVSDLEIRREEELHRRHGGGPP